jgi:sulfoquinovose isomerase
VPTSWTDLASHRSWLDGEGRRLLSFAEQARREDAGFAWLDSAGTPLLDRPLETWLNARMTHVFALASLRGIAEAGPFADHGVRALRGPLQDGEHGGWLAAASPDGRPSDPAKVAYQHAFVVLAASTATIAGRPGAEDLLQDALAVMEAHFWREDDGRCLEDWDRAWSTPEPYRGANSNMHAVEAFLAAADVTGDGAWRERALRIAGHVVNETARAYSWRLVEHFDAQWRPLPEYNRDSPGHPFRPYGATVGHWLEWSRLLLHLDASLAAPPDWLLEAAIALFDSALAQGWAVDGRPGFVYTVDWDGRPVVRTRMHWVLAEAIAAAAALRRRTGDNRYEQHYRAWWEHATEVFLDLRDGSWRHELDERNRPASTVWQGKPDVYHAYQATLFPQLPLSPVAAVALAGGAPERVAEGAT